MGVGGPGDRAGARRRGAGDCCASGSASWSRGRWRRDARGLRAARGASRCRRRCSTRSAPRASSPSTEDRSAPRDRARLRRPGAAARAAPRGRPRRGRCCPPTPSAVRRVLEVCAAEGVAVVPFGGGTSVVGGVEPLRGAHQRLISLDLGAPARGRGRPPLADRAPRRRPARARGRGGARRARASTLGHFPQSFEYATIGGFAATRSAGQASSGYGRFDALVSSVRLIAPAGEMRDAGDPAHRRRPGAARAGRRLRGRARRDPRRDRAGPPGADACAATRPGSPRASRPGAEIVRALAQGPGLPDVIRVSDEEETGSRWRSRGRAASPARLFDGYLGLRRRRGGCLIVVGLEGEEESVARRRALAVRALRAGGAAYLGQAAGRSWEHGRYQGPYLRDTLMDDGGDGRDARDLAHLEPARRAARAPSADGDPRLARRPGHARARLLPPLPRLRRRRLALLHLHRPRPRRRRARAVARGQARRLRGDRRRAAARSPTTTRSAATTPPTWRPRSGSVGLEALRAVKERLDPAGIMNPGKLIP